MDGDETTFASADDDVSANPMTFQEARARLAVLLARVGWPPEVDWIDACHIRSFPWRVFLFARGGKFESEHDARATFEAAMEKCEAVRMGAVGTTRGRTVSAVFPIVELGQGEAMFIDRGVKIDVPADEPAVTVTSSPLRWWWICRRHRKWIDARDAALRTG